MRLMLIGPLHNHMAKAGQIAMQNGAQVGHVDNTDKALSLLREGKGADIILMDVSYSVSQFITRMKQERLSTPVIACGIGEQNHQDAINAIKGGAKEYLPLPPEPEMIAAVFEVVANKNKKIIFDDPCTKEMFETAREVAASEATVLITGESGTGKEVLARFVHDNSKRKNENFVSVNCAAIPENLLESELFGHEKGAFTGAVARRIGKFEEANGGTLLLDEISEMAPHLQAKLLRAIQEREIDRVGGTKPVKVNFRLIATSNRNMLEAVEKKEFREDLYFRLNVIHLKMPPLRERPKDIISLGEFFIAKYAELNGINSKTLTTEARNAMLDYTWPGNVRELENLMHRAVILGRDGQILPADIFPKNMQSGTNSPKAIVQAAEKELVGRTVADVEKDLIIDTLKHCLGNRTQAASILGISIRTLRNKLKQYEESGEL